MENIQKNISNVMATNEGMWAEIKDDLNIIAKTDPQYVRKLVSKMKKDKVELMEKFDECFGDTDDADPLKVEMLCFLGRLGVL